MHVGRVEPKRRGKQELMAVSKQGLKTKDIMDVLRDRARDKQHNFTKNAEEDERQWHAALANMPEAMRRVHEGADLTVHEVSCKALPFYCASTVFLSKTVPFLVVLLRRQPSVWAKTDRTGTKCVLLFVSLLQSEWRGRVSK
eukprot:SAG22_NODE_2531_length_2469_cov_1.339662_3_plen_142_part_00